MIDLMDIKYDKKNGLITTVAIFDGCSYNLTIDTNNWTVFCDDTSVPNMVTGKVRFRFREIILLKRKMPSRDAIVWC